MSDTSPILDYAPKTRRRLLPWQAIAAILAAAIAVGCVIVAAWGTVAKEPFEEGVAVGNKEIVSFRQGVDFRVGFLTPTPIFGTHSRAPSAEERVAEESAWGRPNHWLRLPDTDFSLWWPFSVSAVLLGAWVLTKRPRSTRGFPVTAARRAR